jgi:hypothetical protein
VTSEVLQEKADFRSHRLTVAAGGFLTASFAVLLLRFPPDRYSFYPRCPIFTYLHLQCPGCGTTRALAALLHGNLREALHYNPLTTALLPAALLYLAYVYLQRNKDPMQIPTPVTYALLTVAAIFTVVRNLPL